MRISKLVVSITIILAGAVLFSGCLRYTSNLLEVTRSADQSDRLNEGSLNQNQSNPYNAIQQGTNAYTPTSYNNPSYAQPTGIYPSETPSVSQQPVTNPIATTPPVTQAPVTQQPQQQQPQQNDGDPSQWTKDQILSYLTNAVNTAKAYKGNLTVSHTEAFANFNITKCPGGSLGINLANRVASSVMKPTDETLNYSGGLATNKEGKTIPILLPKRQEFKLQANGIQSARAYTKDGHTVIDIVLVQESTSINEIPQHNASSIGYLDLGEVEGLDKLVTIEKFNVIYSGSTLVAEIDAQGRIINVRYSIPVNIIASGKALNISGEIECSGAETEEWKLTWN